MIGELLLQPGSVRVILHGELDIATVQDLRALLSAAAESDSPKVIVDLTDVPFTDVVSLSTILATADALAERGATLRVSGARAAIRRVCALLNADDVLEPSSITHREVS